MNKQAQLQDQTFITQVFEYRDDSRTYLYTSRRMRKGLDDLLGK